MPQLGLPVLKFRAHLYRLRGSVAKWDVDGDAHAFVGRGGIDQLVQSATVARRWSNGDQGAVAGAAFGPAQNPRLARQGLISAEVRWVLRTSEPRAAVIGKQVHGG